MKMIVLVCLYAVIACTSFAHGAQYEGVEHSLHITSYISTLYNITKDDVLNYSMIEAHPGSYPAEYGLDGDMNTQAIIGYNTNFTFWSVMLKKSYTIIRVYAMYINYKDIPLSLNITKDNSTVGVYPFEKMNGSWTYKLCDVSSLASSAVTGNIIQLQKRGDGFYLKETVIQTLPYIDFESDPKLSSYLNITSACWQTVIHWKVGDACCSGELEVKVYRDEEILSYSSSHDGTPDREYMITVEECSAPNQNNNYILQLNNDQITKNISVNYTSPLLISHLQPVDVSTVNIYNLSTTTVSISFIAPADLSKVSPKFYTAQLYQGDLIVFQTIATCNGPQASTGRCFASFDGLNYDTTYRLRIQTTSLFAGGLFNLTSQIQPITTKECSDPEAVTMGMIRDLLYKDKYDLDLKVKFKPGDSNCDYNNTYIMYAQTVGAPDEVVVCDGVRFYCNAQLTAHTLYNIIIETVNSVGYGANSTLYSYLTPTKAPSAPHDIGYNITLHSITVVWSAPVNPRGDLTTYEITFLIQKLVHNPLTGLPEVNETSGSVLVNADTLHYVFWNITSGSNLTVQLRAKTKYWGRYSPKLNIHIPDQGVSPDVMFEKPLINYPDVRNSCLSLTYQVRWNDSLHKLEPHVTVYTKVICRALDCYGKRCELNFQDHFKTDFHTTDLCGLVQNETYNCASLTVDYYNIELTESFNFTVKAASRVSPGRSAMTTLSYVQAPDQTVTLIAIGVAGMIILLSIVLITLAIVRKRRQALEISEADSYFSLMSSDHTSMLSDVS